MGCHKIKNLIFDVGGVLIDYRWEDMLADYGLDEQTAQKVGTTIFEDEKWSEFDAGRITSKDLVAYYQVTYPDIAVHMQYMLEHGELMHVKLPKVWAEIKRLHESGYGCYYLSNYSEQLFRIHTSDCWVMQEMDGGVVSYEIKAIKPDRQIYETLLRKYDLQAEECLFFDDRPVNVEAAIQCGMQASVVRDTESFIEQLRSIM